MSIAVGAGFTPDDGQSIFVTKGGDDTQNDGTTSEKPVITIGQGLSNALAGGKTAVIVADGSYDEIINAVNQTDIRGVGSAILSSTPAATTITAANDSVLRLGFLGAQTNGSTALQFDGNIRSRAVIETLFLGPFFGPQPDSIVGISIDGVNDDIPSSVINGECNATNATFVKIRGEVDTPPTIDLGTWNNLGDGCCICDHVPSNPSQITEMSVAFTNNGGTGLELFRGTSGTLNVTTKGINAAGETIANVGSGLKFGMTGVAIAGNINVLAGGNYLVPALGLHVGDLNIQGNSNIFQNTLTGSLTIGTGGVFDGIIGKVSGTVSIDQNALDNENVNGIINGVAYGTYKNPSFTYEFSRQTNINNGSYLRSENIQTSASYGPLAVANLVPEILTWNNIRTDPGTLEVWSEGSRFGTVDKPFGFLGYGMVVPDTAGDFIPIGSSISIRWVAGSGNGRMRNALVNLNCRRYV